MPVILNGIEYLKEDVRTVDDLSVGDDAVITDALTVGGNITLTSGGSVISTANGNVSIVPNGTGIFYCGAGSPGHLTPTTGEAYFQGIVEFDGNVYIDGSLYNYGGMLNRDNISFGFGNSSDAEIRYSTPQTPDTLLIAVSAESNGLIICEKGDVTYDFAHALQDNPTVFIQSANQSATEWGSFAHNKTDFVITSGAGAVKLAPATDVKIEAKNIATDTTTGMQIATAAAQKIGFYGTTPAIQPSHVADPAACAAMTFSHSWDGETYPVQAEGDALSTDLAALKSAIDANNSAIDTILAQLATLGLQAAS